MSDDATPPEPSTSKPAGKSKPKPPALQGLKPGRVLKREYKGKEHVVTVKPDGFRYGKKTYTSLTAIAMTITGAKSINGPAWFHLRKGGAT